VKPKRFRVIRYLDNGKFDNGKFFGVHIKLFGGWLLAVERRAYPDREDTG